MPRAPYTALPPESLILRDQLALDRTVLANERTLLAHVRTALGMLAAGAGVAHFLDSAFLTVIGWGLAGLSPVSLALGVWRYQRIRARLAVLDETPAVTQ